VIKPLVSKSLVIKPLFIMASCFSYWGLTIATTHPVSAEINLNRTRQGMVTSAHPLASEIGLKILREGGNAVDAAVATTIAISVVEPFSAGIGGGGFLLFYDGKTVKALDFRERAPMKATPSLYLNSKGQAIPGLSINGPLAVAVPGTIAGLYEVQRRYGKLRWAKVVEPSVSLARDGFPVTMRFQMAMGWRKEAMEKNAEARRIFLPKGQVPTIGDRLIQTDLARTLQMISQDPNAMYTGALAQTIVADQQSTGGLITAEDLKQYKPIWRDPVCGLFAIPQDSNSSKPLSNFRVCSMPPPSSGGVHLLQMLNLLELDRLKQNLKQQPWHHPDSLHRLIESMRIAYADRATHLGDPDFVKVPVNALISKAYADRRRKEINPEKATPSIQVKAADPSVLKESNETSHLTVVDRDRNAVSLTFTVNLAFGAGIVVPGTGIVLNNEMDDFAIAPMTPNAFGLTGNAANAIAPRKTPLSSMTPTIVLQSTPSNSARSNPEQFRLATGAPGGSTIITTVLQVLVNTLVYDMDMERAIAAPRLHHQWLPDQTRIDRWGFDPLTQDNLKHRGHVLLESQAWGNANGIQLLPDGSLDGAVDPRGEGAIAGY
jgi:gamma-glutamyltranspeptidase / glutathione hydrolase